MSTMEFEIRYYVSQLMTCATRCLSWRLASMTEMEVTFARNVHPGYINLGAKLQTEFNTI